MTVRAAPPGLARVLNQLQHVRRMGDSWRGKCPGPCDDHHAALSIREGSGGRVLLYCFKGCQLWEIVCALGLKVSDLFARSKRPRRVPAPPLRAETEYELARAMVLREEESLQRMRNRWTPLWALSDAVREHSKLVQRYRQLAASCGGEKEGTWFCLAEAAHHQTLAHLAAHEADQLLTEVRRGHERQAQAS